MDKRYQVFISSTFLDLKEERQAVSQALLRSHCFPAQMENWPAMDAEQMEAIKQIIDESDYYLVISAGKYGSISPETGLSYTEMEYDYAMEIGKPVIRLLHRDPFNALRGEQIEKRVAIRKKLEAFHTKLKAASVCSFWQNADQLEKETVFALIDIIRRKPSDGWVRNDGKITQSFELENFKLNKQLARLEAEAARKVDSKVVVSQMLDALCESEFLWGTLDQKRIFHAIAHAFEREDYVGNGELNYYLHTEGDVHEDDCGAVIDALTIDKILSRTSSSHYSLTAKAQDLIARSRISHLL